MDFSVDLSSSLPPQVMNEQNPLLYKSCIHKKAVYTIHQKQKNQSHCFFCHQKKRKLQNTFSKILKQNQESLRRKIESIGEKLKNHQREPSIEEVKNQREPEVDILTGKPIPEEHLYIDTRGNCFHANDFLKASFLVKKGDTLTNPYDRQELLDSEIEAIWKKSSFKNMKLNDLLISLGNIEERARELAIIASDLPVNEQDAMFLNELQGGEEFIKLKIHELKIEFFDELLQLA